MKRIILILLIAALVPTPVTANNRADIVGIAALSVLDLYTSDKLFELPNKIELNPLLPEHPTTAQMVTFGGVGLATLFVIDELFEDSYFKDVFFESVTATQKLIINNHLSQLSDKAKPVHAFIVVISGEF